mmetsp:Transcript_26285/g.55250  ORF Transcript_26285/g.55250 Transcript_26285/m.55250 type:complete len:128 (-) Transcript_26285:114-497(-)
MPYCECQTPYHCLNRVLIASNIRPPAPQQIRLIRFSINCCSILNHQHQERTRTQLLRNIIYQRQYTSNNNGARGLNTQHNPAADQFFFSSTVGFMRPTTLTISPSGEQWCNLGAVLVEFFSNGMAAQ